MFAQRKISVYLIKKILRCFCIDIDATRTALLLGVNRKMVNHYFLRCRIAIYAHRVQEKRKIIGQAECDEAYFGARRRRGFHGTLKRGRGTSKQPVFGIFERQGEVFTEIVPDCKKQTLQDLILGKVAKETVIYTDGWRGYDGLVAVGYDKHLRVNHRENEFSQGDGVHINGIESFWSFTKRRLAKFNGVKVNFPLHLKECEWRWKKDLAVLEQALWKILKRHDTI